MESLKDAVVVSDLEEEEEEGNFLERMKRRDQREVRRGILQGGEPSPRLKKYPAASLSRSRKKPAAAAVKPNPIEELDCSQDMKSFMLTEHAREKVLYKDVPESQIANSIIHRFRTHLANSGKSRGGNGKTSASSRKKPLSSVEIGSGDDSEEEEEEEEVSIQEFDEAELQPPAEGSFSLSPSPRQLRSCRSLLLRFTTDREAFPITNGPSQVLSKYSLGNEEPPAGEEKKKVASKAGRKFNRKSPRRTKRAVVELVTVEPRKEGAKRRKLEELQSCPAVAASSGSKAVTTSQGDTKTKTKTVTINSQPEYFSSSEPADELCPEVEEEVRQVPLKSILKKETLPSSREVEPSPQPKVGAETDGKEEEPVSQERPRSVKRNLLSKFNEATPLSDEKFANLVKDMEKIHNSPNISLDEEEDGTKYLEDLVNKKLCGGCGRGPKRGPDPETWELWPCGWCETVVYCDEICQRADWANHKQVCERLAKLMDQEKRDGKARKQEKKALIRSVLSPGAANTPVKSGPACPISTPENSPSLARSIRTHSGTRNHRKKFLPVNGRSATPHHSQEENLQGVEGLLILPRKINFAAFAVNDEVVEQPGEILLPLSSGSSSSLEMVGGSNSLRTGKEEESEPPSSSLEILSECGSQKVNLLGLCCGLRTFFY